MSIGIDGDCFAFCFFGRRVGFVRLDASLGPAKHERGALVLWRFGGGETAL